MINFDIDTKILEKCCPFKDWRRAYRLIKDFMLEHEFKWQQGSSYVSVDEIGIKEATSILIDLTNKYYFLKYCIRDCRITTVVNEEYDVGDIFEYDKYNEYLKNQTNLQEDILYEIEDAELEL